MQSPKIRNPITLILALAALGLALAACGGDPESTAASEEEAAPQEARLAAIPSTDGDAAQDELPPGHPPMPPPDVPPGHPPMGQAAPPMDLPPVPQGAGTGASGLAWTTPEGWVEVPPASSMRRAQYRVPGEAGDGELVVFYFGPGQGGTAEANAERWLSQFSAPGGGPAPGETRTLEVNGMRVLLVEATGTYSGGMTMMGAPDQSLDGYMLLGAVAEGPDSNWFFKLTGPEATLAGQKQAFEGMIGSLQPGG